MVQYRNTIGKEISFEDLRTLQLDILTAIHEFCIDNNIRYSLSCGTLLGAVRHGGYIPWDDDIDIYVPRSDYQKLITIFPDTYREHYKLSSLERVHSWEIDFAKAYDNRTLIKEKTLLKDKIGVNIDIFPIDDVPDDEGEWTKYDKRRRQLMKVFRAKINPLEGGRCSSKNIGKSIIRALSFFYSNRRFACMLNNFAQKHNGIGYIRCFECCQGIFQKNPFPKSLFDDLVDIKFEDRFFKAFADADVYLKMGYGNYMELPPIEKRVAHHDFKAFWIDTK